MGLIAALNFTEGTSLSQKTTTMKLLLLTALAAVAMAEPEAEAGYYGYHPGFYGYYGHQLNWPAYSAPGFSSQCFGCRGKRSAEADAEPGYYGYPYGYHGYPYAYGFGYGHALPGHSYTHVSRVLGKRSAEADAEPGYYGLPYYGYPYGYYGYPIIPAVKSGYEHDLPGDSNVRPTRKNINQRVKPSQMSSF